MTQKSTRRDFLKQSTIAAGTAWWVGNSAFGFANSSSPNEKINFACIGVGGKGSSDTGSAGEAGHVAALCDVDLNSLKAKANAHKDAQQFQDFREMLDKLGDKIDAVTVSTPDHTHAAASVMAMRMGKHCFCQKPLTWSIGEARVMRELAAEKKLATQMGNQGTALTSLREAVEIIQAGAIGKVSEVHVWTNRPIWPQGTGRPKPSDPPAHVNWDLFLGPAPERPYSDAYHPFKWRGWLDFGTGALGDMACHTMNLPVMALELFDAKTVEVVENSGIVENETYPKFSVLKYEFPATDKRGPVALFWYDGGKKPALSLFQGALKDLPGSGMMIIGDVGMLYSASDYGGSYELFPKEKFQGFKPPEPTLPRSPGHFEEFAAAIKGGPAAMSNFNYAGRLTETILVGNLALRLGKKIEWDAANMVVTNAQEEAKELIMRKYREGWKL